MYPLTFLARLFVFVLLLVPVARPEAYPDFTCFQEGGRYSPAIDIAADVAIVYGTHDFAARAAEWRDRGYEVSLMTGISWGAYGDYYGSGDAFKKNEVQTNKAGRVYMHGDSTDVGYNVPSPAYVEFIKQYIKPSIDAGVRGIYLEEPEFWAETGWSEAFKAEWQRFYNEPWRDPDSSPDAQYRASKLKYELYFNALKEVFEYVDQQATERGISIECHVPTHSLINYAQWRIVSPESHLIDIPQLDGYIAQVWTGTARSKNIYRGEMRERTFETAFLEYGQMYGMVQPTGKKVWFLADPVEDNPNRSWADYERNYEATVTASLMWPAVHRFEVMPWPGRIFDGQYRLTDEDPADARVPMPAQYATKLLTVINALNNMNQSEVVLEGGSQGIGVIVSDTMMFQRAAPQASDAHLGGFFGLAMPLVKAGIPVGLVQLENTPNPNCLRDYKVLLLTYEHQKPLKAIYHDAIAEWVKGGGKLLFVDDGADPYNHVREWWNENGSTESIPQDDLFRKLGTAGEATENSVAVGKGLVRVLHTTPSALAGDAKGADVLLDALREMIALTGDTLATQHFLRIRRGPYVIASVFEEAASDASVTTEGQYLDLFSADLPSVTDPQLKPGQRALYVDLDRVTREQPNVVAAGSRIRNAAYSGGVFVFDSRGPARTTCVACVAMPSNPAHIATTPAVPVESTWDAANKLLRLRFPNSAETVRFEIRM